MASLDIDDTIAAIPSPLGTSERGIVRVSGPDTLKCVAACFRPHDNRSLEQQTAVDAIPGELTLGDNLPLPGRLLIWPTDRSYTRQPSAEFHTIGSSPLLQLALQTVCEAGARVARPGEFTLRAFLSGRLDLTQAEAVLAVIDAKGQDDLRLSLDQLAGGLATPLTSIRNELISILAELEAQLDFADEDIEFISDSLLFQKLDLAREQLDSIVNQISGRHVTEEKFAAVLTGLPNAGKSSLFNQLLGESKAIVTNVAGTTTDYVTGELSQSGVTIQLIDTAGFEHIESQETDSSQIQASAQGARKDRIERADLRVQCLAADAPAEALIELTEMRFSNESAAILVITQTDRPLTDHVVAALREIESGSTGTNDAPDVFQHIVHTSSTTSVGVDDLRNLLFQLAIEAQSSDSPIVGSTLRRTSDSLIAAAKSVQLARQAASEGIGEELVAAEIRHSLDHLGCVVGTVYTDDILDVVFGQFCIGK
jgi:tRNA modification GTPase